MTTKQVTIYHNPSCSKSRRALEILLAQGIQPKVIEYLQNPPDKTKLENLLAMLELQPEQLVRTREAAMHISEGKQPKNTDQWLDLLHNHPETMQRPIVTVGNKAIIGRPPEKVLELLNAMEQ